jgi:hypothetical protein
MGTVTCPEAGAAEDDAADPDDVAAADDVEADDDELVAPEPHPPRASPNVTNAAVTEPVVVIRMTLSTQPLTIRINGDPPVRQFRTKRCTGVTDLARDSAVRAAIQRRHSCSDLHSTAAHLVRRSQASPTRI